MKNKAVIVGGFNPYENSNKIKKILGKDLSLISLDFLPRISRAQKMDALSSNGMLEANLENFGVRALPTYHFDKAEVINQNID